MSGAQCGQGSRPATVASQSGSRCLLITPTTEILATGAKTPFHLHLNNSENKFDFRQRSKRHLSHLVPYREVCAPKYPPLASLNKQSLFLKVAQGSIPVCADYLCIISTKLI